MTNYIQFPASYCKRTISVPEPEFSVQGYASATVCHATVHKIPMLQKKPFEALNTEFKHWRAQSTPFTE